MGYYSDVSLGIGLPNRDALTAFLAAVRLGGEISPETIDEYTIVELTDGKIILHSTHDGVKWYEAYDDVLQHHALLGIAQEHKYATAFIRIGENYDDVEVQVDDGDDVLDMWKFFHVNRTITSPPIGESVEEYMNKPKEV